MVDALHQQPAVSPRWRQFLGAFLVVELISNAVIAATVSVVGWYGPILAHRIIIQLVILAAALVVAILMTVTGVVTRLQARRAAPMAAMTERQARQAARIEHLEQMLAEARAATVRAERARHDAEQAYAAITNAPDPVHLLVTALRTVIAADEVERQSAHLWRCHRNARDELICTLPLGRRHGIAEGVQFTVVDAPGGQALGRFRVTGTAETFAACTLMEGVGWLHVAAQYGDAPLPPHELHFALPDAVRGTDAKTADDMLQLLAALTANDPGSPSRPNRVTRQEVTR